MTAFRRTLYRHQDGLALCMTLAALRERGIVSAARPGADIVTVIIIPDRDEPGAGYVQVALRCLTLVGWLTPDPDDPPRMLVSPRGAAFWPLLNDYADLGVALAGLAPLDLGLLRDDPPRLHRLLALVDRAVAGWPRPHAAPLRAGLPEAARHFDGALLTLLIPLTARLGWLGDHGLGCDTPGSGLLRLLTAVGWLHDGRWTDEGREGRSYALHYGLLGSYFPMLCRLPALFRREGAQSTHRADEDEQHVDRVLNVLASGAAHYPYFRQADHIFDAVFDAEPVASQPRFVADMGSGDGSWLVRIYQRVQRNTLRGRHLDSHPLTMIGADFNEKARITTAEALAAAGVPGLTLFGDVTDPGQFAASLAQHGLDARDGLHIRAFIDHNRRMLDTGDATHDSDEADEAVDFAGAYVDERGRPVPPSRVYASLVEHLGRWAEHVGRHGLVVLEAHTVPARVAAAHLADTHAASFETYHGYSHQYPVEHRAFERACRAAALVPTLVHHRRFPSTLPFVAVTVDHLVPRGPEPTIACPDPAAARGWTPPATLDRADGLALHDLVDDGGRPRSWCAAATGTLVRAVVDALRELLDRRTRGDTLTLVDYGCGTGLATRELLRALEQLGLLNQMSRRGIALQIVALDLPTSWFAVGHDLLSRHDCVRFVLAREPDASRFTPLPELLGTEQVDIVMASMVFHLVPPAALPGLFDQLAAVLRADGCLLWSSPDIAPALPGSLLFHDPNREVRRRALEMLAAPETLHRWIADGRLPASHAAVDDAVAAAASEREAAAARADRQILPRPNRLADLDRAMRSFGAREATQKLYAMLPGESLDALLVPANQRYLGEFEDPTLRRALCSLLMRQVTAELCAGDASTGTGHAVCWSFGRADRQPRARRGAPDPGAPGE